MTLTDTADIPALAAALHPKPVEWVEYRDPLAPERANPYRWVDGMLTKSVVDSPREKE